MLFGGTNGGGPLNDTWEYDGISWTQLSPLTSPDDAIAPNRIQHAMAYDAARGRVVLHSGLSGGVGLDHTWVFNGLTWYPRGSAYNPAGRRLENLTYDTQRGRIVGFGGVSPSAFFGELVELAVSCGPLGTGTGTGTGNNINTPPIVCLNRPIIGTSHDVMFDNAGGAAVMAYDLGPTVLLPPIVTVAGACGLFLSFITGSAVYVVASGSPAIATVVIPNIPALIDVPLAYQGFFMNLTGTCFRATEGLAVRLRDR